MVSPTNVEAVAANNVALQHFGQKVVHGHVMTNSGRRILIQVTFDVILSTSALKSRGVTIIFNHDYDRISFRNETVNLVSHDCHSYLHITLANGIPTRKALVRMRQTTWMMKSTATMVSRDMRLKKLQLVIDEQSPMRIQLDISGELKTARTLRTPEPLTDAARMAHNATHVPFRDWCLISVASCGGSSTHRRVVVNKTADTLPKFQTDYMFI